jgi:hypothetical protein
VYEILINSTFNANNRYEFVSYIDIFQLVLKRCSCLVVLSTRRRGIEFRGDLDNYLTGARKNDSAMTAGLN